MGGQLGFLYRQLTFKPQPLSSSVRLANQVAIVTGANAGLGLEAARELIAHGLGRLIIAVRNENKGEEARAELQKNIPNLGCEVNVWQIDQENLQSIASFTERVATLDRLDIVILNAGVKVLKYAQTSTGHETNVQVNHLGTSLLSLLLVPHLQASAKKTNKPSRLTIVGSEGHFWCAFKEHSAPKILSEMDKPESFGAGMERYYSTKLLNLLWMRELASRVEGKDVIINCVNPGFCASTLHRHDASAGLKIFLRIFAWSSAQGAHCLVDAAVNGDASLHGAYISEQRPTR